MGIRLHTTRRTRVCLALLLGIALVLVCGSASALARGGGGSGEPWIAVDAAYLKRFPAELRAAIAAQAKLCGPDAAVHPAFARYIHRAGEREVIALHYHHMRCAERSRICGAQGCLHQVFAPSGGAYHLLLNARVGDVELTLAGGHVAIRSEANR